jgi:serologically defined colon cancer antigen 8
MTKVKDVISENETLAENTTTIDADDVSPYKPYMKSTKFTATSGPNILFESRISELEAQLAQLNIDYKKLSDENVELKRKRAMGGDSYVDVACADAYKKQIENLQRDKNALEDTVKKMQKQITELKELDVQVYSKTQRNRDLVDQVNFERTQADIEIRRLKVNSKDDKQDII